MSLVTYLFVLLAGCPAKSSVLKQEEPCPQMEELLSYTDLFSDDIPDILKLIVSVNRHS